MKNINKKIIISIFVFLIILLLSISIIIAKNSSKKTNFEIDIEKVYYEIKYIDSQLVSMLHLLNNIDSNTNFYINWEELNNQTQSLYRYWNSVILDFNYLDIDKNTLTKFGQDLDQLSIAISNQDEDIVGNKLIELYQNLTIYSQTLNNDKYNILLVTKYNLLNSLAIAEKENWTLIYEYIQTASNNISNLVNQMDNNKYIQHNINQAYISIKELENIINSKDLKVYYFKYKMVMNNIEKIKTGEV